MAIDDLATDFLSGALKALGKFFGNFVVEILIKGLGYLLCRPFSRNIDPESSTVGFVGVLAWLMIFLTLYYAYDYLSAMT